MTITGAGRSACERCRVLMPIADLLPYSRIAAAAAPKRFLSLCAADASAEAKARQSSSSSSSSFLRLLWSSSQVASKQSWLPAFFAVDTAMKSCVSVVFGVFCFVGLFGGLTHRGGVPTQCL